MHFCPKGVYGRKIADIAALAGVSTGNIYRYYKNKNEIFNSIIPESLPNEMRNTIIGKINAAKNESAAGSPAFQNITDVFIRFILANRKKFIIIFSGSKGTPCEHLESEMVEALLGAIRKIYPQKYAAYIKKYGNDFMPHLLYHNLFRVYGAVMARDTSTEEAEDELRQVSLYHFSGITSLFEA